MYSQIDMVFFPLHGHFAHYLPAPPHFLLRGFLRAFFFFFRSFPCYSCSISFFPTGEISFYTPPPASEFSHLILVDLCLTSNPFIDLIGFPLFKFFFCFLAPPATCERSPCPVHLPRSVCRGSLPPPWFTLCLFCFFFFSLLFNSPGPFPPFHLLSERFLTFPVFF